MKTYYTYYKLINRYDDEPEVIEVTGPNDQKLGVLSCGCCSIFADKNNALHRALFLLRGKQERILAELAECENKIVTYERELSN